ncbi:DUF6920 family protein [Arthrobacter sp. 9AX]|uniref:DUF6920 family protein n=1 Tax=Arthrobacter sp. 9AX TaxID=2653131 RepID=UPI003FA42D0A
MRGFIWVARSRLFGLPIHGFDRLASGEGEMRWRLLNLLPVMTVAGTDVTRSARGRLAAEAALLPTAFRGARWSKGPGRDVVTMSRTINGEDENVHMKITPQGRVDQVWMMRWGNPDGSAHGRCPFGVSIEEETRFSGVLVPSVTRAGWWWGTDRRPEGEFFHARINRIRFF